MTSRPLDCSGNCFTDYLKCHGDKIFYIAVVVIPALLLFIIVLLIIICRVCRRYGLAMLAKHTRKVAFLSR